MAVFPRRFSALSGDAQTYIPYMVERLEFTIANLEKENAQLKQRIAALEAANGGENDGE